jgi:hypothetical protein
MIESRSEDCQPVAVSDAGANWNTLNYGSQRQRREMQQPGASPQGNAGSPNSAEGAKSPEGEHFWWQLNGSTLATRYAAPSALSIGR